MKLIGYILALVICASSIASDAAPQRVIVEISRGYIVTGEVISRTDKTLVIRDQHGKEITIDLDSVSRVVPLVEGGDSVTGTVYLKDGRNLRGTIIQDGFRKVILSISGVTLHFNRDQVDRVVIDPPFEETYQQLLLNLDLSRPDHFQMFIEWLLKQNQLDLALSHLSDTTLSTAPINALRRRTIIRLKSRDQQKLDTQDKIKTPADKEPIANGKVLSDKEVNLIRAYEVNHHYPPELVVPKETRARLLQHFSDDPRLQTGSTIRTSLLEGSDIEAFQILRMLRAEQFYDGVQIIGEPESLRRFKEDVHDAWLINRCGMRACHGSEGQGRFFLRTKPEHSDRARYANLLMLDRLVVDPKWPLINYDDPSQSLFIQYALPRSEADHPHPEVKKWRPAREMKRDGAFNAAIAWIRSMRQVPRPEYPIEFPLQALPEPPCE